MEGALLLRWVTLRTKSLLVLLQTWFHLQEVTRVKAGAKLQSTKPEPNAQLPGHLGALWP